MQTLERVTNQTCVNKIRVMRNPHIILDDEFERCYSCEDYHNQNGCPNYQSYQFTFPVRRGGGALI